MSARKASTSKTSRERADRSGRAGYGGHARSESLFVGLRAEDIVASYGAIGGQAIKNPTLVIEQQAALIRELIAVMAGRSELTPPNGDKRFANQAWRENPLYRMVLQRYVAWMDAIQGGVVRSTLDDRTRVRARFAVSLMASI